LGAIANDWPKFAWTDISIPPLDKNYKHWGVMVQPSACVPRTSPHCPPLGCCMQGTAGGCALQGA
jgi:hypothetical protein